MPGYFSHQTGSRPFHEHYSLVKSKWKKLNLYQLYPADLTTWKRQREELKVISFLAALNLHMFLPSINNSLLLIFPLSILPSKGSHAPLSLLLLLMATMVVQPSQPLLFLPLLTGRGGEITYGRGGRSGVKQDDRKRDFCKKLGHLEDIC